MKSILDQLSIQEHKIYHSMYFQIVFVYQIMKYVKKQTIVKTMLKKAKLVEELQGIHDPLTSGPVHIHALFH